MSDRPRYGGWCLILCVSFAVTPLIRATQQHAGLHIDHIPLAVRDLAAAERQFRSLGFTIKPGRPHLNGIENASIKFADGSYIELITARHATDALAKKYEDFLQTDEGALYVFLRDPDGAFSDRMRHAGGRRSEAGPFAFTELPSSWRAPSLQITQYLSPASDPPDVYRHANGSRRVVAVWMFVDSNGDPIVSELGASQPITDGLSFDDRISRPVTLAHDTRLLLVSRRANDAPHLVAPAVLIEVESFTVLRKAARLGNVITRGAAVWLPPAKMHGLWLGFIDARSNRQTSVRGR